MRQLFDFVFVNLEVATCGNFEPHSRATRLGALLTYFLLAQNIGYAQEPDPRLYSEIPNLADVSLSPTGAYIAARRILNGSPHVVIYDFDEKKFVMTIDFEDRVNWLRWADDENLLVSTRTHDRSFGIYSTRLILVEPGLARTNRILPPRQAFPRRDPRDWNWSTFFYVYRQDMVVATKSDTGGTRLLISIFDRIDDGNKLWSIPLNDGNSFVLEQSLPWPHWWYIDEAGFARLAMGLYDDEFRIAIRSRVAEDWTDGAGQPLGFTPLLIDSENSDFAYVVSDHVGDLLGLYRWNLQNQSFDESPVLPLRRGFHRVISNPQRTKIYGVRYVSEMNPVVWIRPEHSEIYGRIQAALPDSRIEVESVSDDLRRMVILATAPDETGEYYLFDGDEDALIPFGDAYGGWAGEYVSSVTRTSMSAPDGAQFDIYISYPRHLNAESPQPGRTVIIPHGGPHSHDYFRFDPLVQSLNKVGYTVLQVGGQRRNLYPQEFLRSYKWMPADVDDVIAATDWLVAEGISDPEKICVLGKRNGGYLALLAAAIDPDRYKCIVSVNGPVDAEFVGRGGTFSDLSEVDAHSWPAQLIDEYSAPLLLFYGGENSFIPLNRAQSFRRSLERAGKDVELVVFMNEDHSVESAEPRQQFVAKLLEFLGHHLD